MRGLDSIIPWVSGNSQKLHRETFPEANQGGTIRYLDIEPASAELNFTAALSGNNPHKLVYNS